jgi:hypothetical protein
LLLRKLGIALFIALKLAPFGDDLTAAHVGHCRH